MSAEPRVRERLFKQTVFICDGCEGEKGTVYLRAGKWYCLPCLRATIKRAGGKRQEIWRAAWNAEGARCASRMARVDFPR